MNEKELEVLKEFLSFPLWETEQVFEKFLKYAENSGRRFVYESNSYKKERFLYIEGARENKVVLVAHADTVWDENYVNPRYEQEVNFNDDKFTGTKNDCGIGADDRAGCAIIWLLRNLGHSILITDGEEKSSKGGSKWLVESNDKILTELNEHQFMIQLDRRGDNQFRTYILGTKKFIDFIINTTTFIRLPNDEDEPGTTDINRLCTKICGVNFSIGYHNDHWPKLHDNSRSEYLVFSEWKHTLETVKQLLDIEHLQRFEQ